METQEFTIRPAEFDSNLLPQGARAPGTTGFRDAVRAFFENAFKGFGGQARILVSDERITISWNPDPSRKSALQVIVGKLQRGQTGEGIQLLEVLLAREPDNVDVLYNLGLALSDAGKLDLAEKHLRRALEVAPEFVNGLVALGTTLSRLRREDEAKTVLEAALDLEPENLWAHKNLGVTLLKQGKPEQAAEHLSRAVEINAEDQGSWTALGDAARLAGRTKDAERAYRRAIVLNPHNDLAEGAHQGLTALAHSGYEQKSGGAPRPDAVEYCAAGIKKFSTMPPEEVKQIAAEISMLGRSGLDINNPAKRYALKSLAGDFSGLQLVCYLYVAVQMVAPGADMGFDLSREYRIARELSQIQ